MLSFTATATACPNIAFIKYWGNRNATLRLPSNGSISMNLDGLYTRTRVKYNADLKEDALTINGSPVNHSGLVRVQRFMDEVRRLAGVTMCAQIDSENNFPIGAGIASSSAAFAALSLAATHAAGLDLLEQGLSRLARRGSGSACRSIPEGFVEWQAGTSDKDSYAYSIASPEYWPVADVIAIVSSDHKEVGSSEGHSLAGTSPLQPARVAGTQQRLDFCRQAIQQRDFSALARIVELDSNLLHAVMITSQPALFYWAPASLTVMRAVIAMRKGGLPVCYTLDAGPNVHVLCLTEWMTKVVEAVKQIPGVQQVITARAGGGAHLVAGD